MPMDMTEIVAFSEKTHADPLKNHPAIPTIIDTFYSKNQPHVILKGPSSERLQHAFIESLALNFPEADFFYYDPKHFSLTSTTLENFVSEKPFQVLVIPHLETEEAKHLIKKILCRPTWRLIILDHDNLHSFEKYFTHIEWQEPTELETIALLKTMKAEFMQFHQVNVTDDIFSYAYSLTLHYLGGESIFENTVSLLDHTFAHAKRTNTPLTTETLLKIVSNKTQIPVSHLHHNKLKAMHLVPALQQTLFGQDAAISMIGTTLQSIPLQSHEKKGPLASFLFIGAEGTGKKKLAHTLADYLFDSGDALLEIMPHPKPNSWLDLKIKPTKQNPAPSLAYAIQNKPYAILLFENIDELFKTQMHFLESIFSNEAFRHTIIIMTTTKGHEKLITKPANTTQNSVPVMDLMQIVLNENPLFSSNSKTTHTDFQEKMLGEIKSLFPTSLLQHLQIIPCMPLQSHAIEKIIKQKLLQLSRTLQERFQVELQYAPEVVKFLMHLLNKQQGHMHNFEKIFEQAVYHCVSHTVFSRMNESPMQKRLFLSLNDSGQLLKSEFISSSSTHKEYYS